MTAEQDAIRAAEGAARAAGVRIREVTDLAGFAAVQRLFDGIWQPDPGNPTVTTELLRALTKTGNYVFAAYREGRTVGACVGFFGPPLQAMLHSHIAGVVTDLTGRNVGHALKLHQRAWALERGARTITWTFDPLIRRNAYFNLVKLGAAATEYLPDFYGGMHDGINGDDESDRLLIEWDLRAGQTDPPATDGAVVALGCAADGSPHQGSGTGEVMLVAIPPDVEALRAADPGLARQWRSALREVLGPLLADGARITGFDRAGWYIVSRTWSPR
jgi:predicted GNAT superfamily acetyltransferase